MTNGNGKPLSNKKQVQLMIALTIFAWATQTLRHQWAFGSEATFTEAMGEAQSAAFHSAAPQPTMAMPTTS